MWRIARCFLDGGLPIAEDDVMAAAPRSDAYAIVLANASAHTGEIIAPPLSHAMIDRALEAWRGGAAPEHAVRAACLALPESPADAASDAAMGWMLFCQLGEHVDLAWVGDDHAFSVAGGKILARTAPHSLRYALGPKAPDVASRHLQRTTLFVETARWQVEVGTRIVLGNRSLAAIPAAHVGRLANEPDLRSATQALAVDTTRERPNRPVAVIVAERTRGDDELRGV